MKRSSSEGPNPADAAQGVDQVGPQKPKRPVPIEKPNLRTDSAERFDVAAEPAARPDALGAEQAKQVRGTNTPAR